MMIMFPQQEGMNVASLNPDKPQPAEGEQVIFPLRLLLLLLLLLLSSCLAVLMVVVVMLAVVIALLLSRNTEKPTEFHPIFPFISRYRRIPQIVSSASPGYRTQGEVASRTTKYRDMEPPGTFHPSHKIVGDESGIISPG